MRIVVAGASGFIGGHLVPALVAAGHSVTALVRRPPRAPDEASWAPDEGVLPGAALDGADAVINLCGAAAARVPWTAARKRLLRSSRLKPTALLAAACASHGVATLVNASAVGYYGDREDEVLTETAGAGEGFMADLCSDWEAATGAAARAGVRVVRLRTGLVLGPGGGMLGPLTLLGRVFAGARLGDGRQYWPWISIADHVAATEFLCRSEVHGPVNLTAPNPVTNAAFTAALGAALHRPAPWVVPAFAIRAAVGGFAGEVLGSRRAVPAALLAAGFRFLQPDLDTALRAWAAP